MTKIIDFPAQPNDETDDKIVKRQIHATVGLSTQFFVLDEMVLEIPDNKIDGESEVWRRRMMAYAQIAFSIGLKYGKAGLEPPPC